MLSVLLFIFYIVLNDGINDGGGSLLGPVIFLISSFLGMLVAIFFPLCAGGEILTIR